MVYNPNNIENVNFNDDNVLSQMNEDGPQSKNIA